MYCTEYKKSPRLCRISVKFKGNSPTFVNSSAFFSFSCHVFSIFSEASDKHKNNKLLK